MTTKHAPRPEERNHGREAAFARQLVDAVTVAPFFKDLLRAVHLRSARPRDLAA